MSHLLSPVLHALDSVPAPRALWLRDDDAGWADAPLWALVGHTRDAGLPLALAAIPQAVGEGLAHTLSVRIDASAGLLSLHQHGYAHCNHEPEGARRCEFGPARSAPAQRADLAAGRARLAQLLGTRVQPWFTPPWNRCAAHTPAVLAGLGFAALSRDPAAPAQQQLPELPVQVDWCRHWRHGGPAAVAQALARAFQLNPCVGLMLHHAAMEDDEMRCLQQWGAALRGHPNLRALSMAQAIAQQPQGSPA